MIHQRRVTSAQYSRSGPQFAPVVILCAAACLMLAMPATAQAQSAGGDISFNPIQAVEDAAGAIPGFEGGLAEVINILILMTVLSLAPSILVMCTSFTRIIIVLGLMRQAMGTQSMPPGQIITGIALLLTFVIMTPTFDRIYAEAILPYQQGDPEVASQLDVWHRAKEPIRDFMFSQIEATGNTEGLFMILEYRGYDISRPEALSYEDVDMLTLVPAYVMSELKVAFMIGFRVYLPFLIIDMVIASLLISMGMLMLPPVLISLPFKLLLFVLVDGWQLVVASLIESVVQPPETLQMVTAVMAGGP